MDSKQILLKSACTAALAGLGSALLFGNFDVTYFGVSTSSAIAIGAGCGVGSIISDISSQVIIQKMGVSNQIMNGSTLAVQTGVGAIASAGVLYLGGANLSDNLIPIMAIGASSKLGGDYVYQKVLDPRTGFLPII